MWQTASLFRAYRLSAHFPFTLKLAFFAPMENPRTDATDASLSGTRPTFREAITPVLILGWPMILTQLFIMGTGFVDTVMAGRYSAVDLAGVSLAGNVLWPSFMLLTGQWATATSPSAINSISVRSTQTLWAARTRPSNTPLS